MTSPQNSREKSKDEILHLVRARKGLSVMQVNLKMAAILGETSQSEDYKRVKDATRVLDSYLQDRLKALNSESAKYP